MSRSYATTVNSTPMVLANEMADAGICMRVCAWAWFAHQW
jgi:hypothetical protein